MEKNETFGFLPRDRARQQGLARSRRSNQQHALWNAAAQALSANQKLTVGYVRADGRRLLYTSYLDPSQINNSNFSLGNGLT